MRLDQYDRCLEMIREGRSAEEIQKETQVPASELLLMQNGARMAPYVLLQMTGMMERCPKCGAKVQLPCYYCFLKEHPDAWCVEVVARPIRNQLMPLHITLDEQLLEGEEEEGYDDEDWESEYQDSWG
ncbi:MAG: hypothetical protein IJV70_01370 [Clostridia bacterium]|nr:hypothetical protein [Clostridia bacterium]